MTPEERAAAAGAVAHEATMLALMVGAWLVLSGSNCDLRPCAQREQNQAEAESASTFAGLSAS